MTMRYRDAMRKAEVAQAQTEDLATTLKAIREENAHLRDEMRNLQMVESKYNEYKKREPEIRQRLQDLVTFAE